MTISPDEAFLIFRKWQVQGTPVVLVGSLMPHNPIRGLVAVVTREGVWNSDHKPASTWGFSLSGNEPNFLATAFEGFRSLQPAELPSDIRASLGARGHSVLALTKVIKLPRLPRVADDALTSVEETLFLVEDGVPHNP